MFVVLRRPLIVLKTTVSSSRGLTKITVRSGLARPRWWWQGPRGEARRGSGRTVGGGGGGGGGDVQYPGVFRVGS